MKGKETISQINSAQTEVMNSLKKVRKTIIIQVVNVSCTLQ